MQRAESKPNVIYKALDWKDEPFTCVAEYSFDRSRADGRDWWTAVVEFLEDGWQTTRVVGGSARSADEAMAIAQRWASNHLM